MTATILDTVRSLSSLMIEETAMLREGRAQELKELAEAKLRLTASLELQMAIAQREGLDVTSADGALREAIAELLTATESNAAILHRQIELSRELMDAIADEARRATGSRSTVYRASGGLHRHEAPAPISVNASL